MTGLTLRSRDQGPWSAAGPGGLAGWCLCTAAVLAVAAPGVRGALAAGGPFLVLASWQAACAARLARSDRYRARRDLHRALAEAGGTELLHRDGHLLYQVVTTTFRCPPWRGRRLVTVVEAGEDQLSRLRHTGEQHVTGREYELWPGGADVRVTIRDAAFTALPGGGASPARRQWYREQYAGGRPRPFRAQRARGSRRMEPPETAALARRIRESELLSAAGVT